MFWLALASMFINAGFAIALLALSNYKLQLQIDSLAQQMEEIK